MKKLIMFFTVCLVILLGLSACAGQEPTKRWAMSVSSSSCCLTSTMTPFQPVLDATSTPVPTSTSIPTSEPTEIDQSNSNSSFAGWVETTLPNTDIPMFRWGNANKIKLVVCDIHGDENTEIVCEHFMREINLNPSTVPIEISVVVIPKINQTMNRTNSNGINLNRNFGYGFWASATDGPYAFSEVETKALQTFTLDHNIVTALFLHSGDPYTILYGDIYDTDLNDSTSLRAKSLGYKMMGGMQGYSVWERPASMIATGGFARKWYVSIGVPAITVETASKNNPDLDTQWKGLLEFLRFE